MGVLVTFNIRNLSYWTFWIFNTLTSLFGVFATIVLKTVPVIRNNWMTKEFLLNLTIFFIALANIFCFVLSFVAFVYSSFDYGFWWKKVLELALCFALP